MTSVGLFFAYLMLLMAIGYAVNRLMVPVFGRGWRLFVAPGIIVHELAHALACVLVGADVQEINFWKVEGGHVIHTQPRIHLLGPVLISLAPMIVMTLGLFVLAPLLAANVGDLPWIETVPSSLSGFVGGYLTSLGQAAAGFDWLTLKPWLLIYLMLNVAVTIAPSRADLHNAQWALVGLMIVVILLFQLFAWQLPLAVLWPPLATSLVLLGLALLAASCVRGLIFLLQKR